MPAAHEPGEKAKPDGNFLSSLHVISTQHHRHLFRTLRQALGTVKKIPGQKANAALSHLVDFLQIGTFARRTVKELMYNESTMMNIDHTHGGNLAMRSLD